MKIELTEERFRRLLKLVYLGNHMVNGLRAGDREDPRIAKYDDIEELFLKIADENGYKEWVIYDELAKKFLPAPALEMDEEITSYIDTFIDDIFWEELGARLAERDIVEELGEEMVSRLDEKERSRILTEAEDGYFGEFEENGIDNLRLVQDLVPGGSGPDVIM